MLEPAAEAVGGAEQATRPRVGDDAPPAGDREEIGEERVELSSEEEVDSHEQDRRHTIKVSRSKAVAASR